MTEVIRTERLVLRRPNAGDAKAIARCINDLDVSRWLTRVPFPYDQSDAEAFISRHEDVSGRTFLIFLDDKLVGCVGIEKELGYWLAPDHWGKGIATEAARAVVARHFVSDREHIQSGYFLSNAASRNVLTKLGFVADRITKAICVATGEEHVLQKVLLPYDRWEVLQ